MNSYRSIDARFEALETTILEVQENILSSRAGGDTVGERWSPFDRYCKPTEAKAQTEVDGYAQIVQCGRLVAQLTPVLLEGNTRSYIEWAKETDFDSPSDAEAWTSLVVLDRVATSVLCDIRGEVPETSRRGWTP